jgi:predicted permease
MWGSNRRQDSDFRAEIESHLRLEVDRLIADGMPHAEALSAARRAFGNVPAAQERFYESRRWLWRDHLARDLRHGLRLLAKSPVFTMMAVLTIALGVGATTAVFTLVDTALLRPLPLPSPNRLVFIEQTGGNQPSSTPPYPCLARIPSQTGLFAGLAIFATDELRIEIDGRPEAVFGQAASANWFEVLGVKPALGRLTEARDEQLNPPVAVISDRYWQRRFDRDPAVIGKTIRVRDVTYTIAGVTPPEFNGLLPGRPVDVTLPIDPSDGLLRYSGPWWFDVVARLRPGVAPGQAQAAMNVAFQACMGRPGSPSGIAGTPTLQLLSAAHGEDILRKRFSRPLQALAALVALVLLLATLNVANLLLARGIGRSREFAIRLAVGATRSHLVRQLLTETVLLFGFGALPGVLFAGWGVTVVAALFAQGRRPITLEASLSWRILLFSLTVTLVAGLVSGLFPAWRAFRADPEQALKEGQARTGESRRTASLMRALVGFQVAVSLVLLVGASAFVRTLANLRDVNTGFHNPDVLTMSIELPDRIARSGPSREVWSHVLQAVRTTHGVREAGLCVFTPLSGRDSTAQVRVSGFQAATEAESTVRINHVSEGYFETLGIGLLRGRLLTARDTDPAPKVALINESAARLYFGNRDPIGQRLAFPRRDSPDDVYQIAGVVKDTKHQNLRDPAPRLAYLPIRQPRDSYRRLTLTVASAAQDGRAGLLDLVRRSIAGVDPGLLISEVITMRGQMDSTLLTERLLSGLSAAFGVLGLILAAVGLYGVLSYRVGQQRQAIGIRMALGASPSSVALGVLRHSGWVIAAGLLIGLPVAFLAARTADSMLWGTSSSDPATYLTGAAVLCLAGFFSAWFPAHRAAHIEPAETLRHG